MHLAGIHRLACLAGILAVSLTIAAASAPRPNLLFILTDDQAPWAFGASGNAQAHTPHLDRLAREGARFTHAFTPTPVCSPARASILTGRYGSELGITDFLHPRVDTGIGLSAARLTWSRLLLEAGYATALFGKWHLGSLPEQHPRAHGYGTFAGFIPGGARPKDPSMEIDGELVPRQGFIVDLVTDDAIAWLRRRDRTRPFALSLHFREPHSPYLPVREEDWAHFRDREPAIPNPDLPGLDTERVKKTMREYLASVAAVDRNLGRLLAALAELQIDRQTLVVFSSDHGYNVGHHGLLYKGNARWMLRPEAVPPGTPNVPAGQRPNMFDTSVKVPLVLRWPGVIEPGVVIARTVSHLDWLPTFAALGGAPLPAGAVVRGRNLLPLLRGEAPPWDDDFFAEYSMKHGAQVHLRMLRTPEWKLIRDFHNEGRDELYHLAADPGETRNLIADPDPLAREARQQLHTRLLAKMAEVHDPVLPQVRQRLSP